MKKLTVAMVVMLFTTLTFAQKVQEKDIPANIKSAFQKKYQTATAVEWDKESENFEVSFGLNKANNSS
jgi:uncharacterized protein YdeI (BOF family)